MTCSCVFFFFFRLGDANVTSVAENGTRAHGLRHSFFFFGAAPALNILHGLGMVFFWLPHGAWAGLRTRLGFGASAAECKKQCLPYLSQEIVEEFRDSFVLVRGMTQTGAGGWVPGAAWVCGISVRGGVRMKVGWVGWSVVQVGCKKKSAVTSFWFGTERRFSFLTAACWYPARLSLWQGNVTLVVTYLT